MTTVTEIITRANVEAPQLSRRWDRCAAMYRWCKTADIEGRHSAANYARLTAEHRIRDFFDLVECCLPCELRAARHPLDSRRSREPI